jgi:hypothetical protein
MQAFGLDGRYVVRRRGEQLRYNLHARLEDILLQVWARCYVYGPIVEVAIPSRGFFQVRMLVQDAQIDKVF